VTATYDYIAGMYEAFDYYQGKANETAIFPEDQALEYLSLGLLSEAGEVAGKIKKKIRDGEPFDFREALEAELGDVLWYIALLSDRLGLNLSDVAFNNIIKLQNRKVKGTLRGSGDNR